MGNRIAKIQKPKNWTDEEEWTITWYARDAQGNVLAVYNKAMDSLNFRATEFNIYGSSRIGMVTQPEQLPETPTVPVAHSQPLGLKVYEFSNHLGNVLTTFSDRKIATEGTPGYMTYYTAEILSSTDYYPFGFQMPGRVYQGSYRYGFNGQEKVDEIAGSGNSYTAEFWQYDPRIGRRWNVDPVVKIHESPYACFANNPLCFRDPIGADTVPGITIQEGVIQGDQIVNNITNETQRPAMAVVTAVVLHRTAGSSASGAIAHTKNNKGQTGFHIIIDKDGTVTQVNNLNNRANHVGKPKGTVTNYNSIGIEVVGLHTGKPGEDKWEPLTPEQIEATAQVLVAILTEYDLTFEQVFPHENVSWKTPGEGTTVYNSIQKRVQELMTPKPQEPPPLINPNVSPPQDQTGAGGHGVEAGNRIRQSNQSL